jgi:hypothetical protein
MEICRFECLLRGYPPSFYAGKGKQDDTAAPLAFQLNPIVPEFRHELSTLTPGFSSA